MVGIYHFAVKKKLSKLIIIFQFVELIVESVKVSRIDDDYKNENSLFLKNVLKFDQDKVLQKRLRLKKKNRKLHSKITRIRHDFLHKASS